MGQVHFVVDGQAGSTGKGKMAGVLFDRWHPDVLVCNHGANAGHTMVDKNNVKHVFRQIPTAAAMPDRPSLTLVIGAGAILDIDVLMEEITKYVKPNDTLIIDRRAAVITPEHKEKEAVDLAYIASTCKGVGAALADKISRREGVLLAKDVSKLSPYIGCASDVVHDALAAGASIMYEGCQGYDLDINHGLSYPFCTSRGCTVSSGLADLGLPPSAVGEVVMTFRPYPIRVGNIMKDGKRIGYSGEYWTDNAEINWGIVAQSAGAPEGTELGELTTVTKRLRRVFSFSWERMAMACRVNNPTFLALMFADYIDWSVRGKTEITPIVCEFAQKIERYTNVPVGWVSTGPEHKATFSTVNPNFCFGN